MRNLILFLLACPLGLSAQGLFDSLYIRDAETGKGIETTVYFTSKTRNDSTQTDTAGFYRVRLPKDSIVRVEATAQGYFFESFMVYDYLLKNRIPDTRMTYKGYGNTEMLFPDPGLTENEYQQNRRVEIRVVAEK